MNGAHASRHQFQHLSGFVAQDDVLMGSLTCEEALMFAARLKLPSSIPDDEKVAHARSLLRNLGLEHVKDHLIGYTGAASRNSGLARGLSGGERKRVSVCFELVSNPKILFLDEPTSGLDSFAARAVMENLRDLAFYGRTIVATIHQPSAEIFRMFDYLLLLAEGQTVFYGPAHLALAHFKSMGIVPPNNVNPADFMLKAIHVPSKEAVKAEEEAEEATAAMLSHSKELKRSNGTIEMSRMEDLEANDHASGLRAATKEQVNTLISGYRRSKFNAKVNYELGLGKYNPDPNGVAAKKKAKHAKKTGSEELDGEDGQTLRDSTRNYLTYDEEVELEEEHGDFIFGSTDAAVVASKTSSKKHKKNKSSSSDKSLKDFAGEPSDNANLVHRRSDSKLAVDVPKGYSAGYFRQFWLLTGRAFTNLVRDPSLLRARAFQAIAISLLAGLIWLRLKKTQAGAADRYSSTFFILTSNVFGALNGPTFVFPSERGVFFREKASNMYSTGIYYLTKYMAELPSNIIFPIISTTISYWMIGFNDHPVPWLVLCGFSILLNIVGHAVGMLLTCAILDTGIVIKIQPMIVLPLMIFSGFFVNDASVRNYFVWLDALSFLKYAFRGSCNAIFSLGKTLVFQCPASGCRFANGHDVLVSLNFIGKPIWEDAIILLGYGTALHIFAFIALYIHVKTM